MRGYIKKRGKDSYTVVISLGKDPETGKYRQQWEAVKGSKKQAETRLTELLAQLDTGTYMKPSKTTVAEFLDKWLADYAKPKLSPRGFERYAGIIRQHFKPDFGSLMLSQLRPEHLQKHYAARRGAGLSARTIKYHHAVIHKALETAVKWGLMARNVADGVDAPAERRNEMQTWNEDEIARFLEAAKTSQYYALFYTALFTGMRRSELLGLQWQDVDFTYSQVYVSRGLHHLKDGSYVFTQPKSEKSRRTIALPPSAYLVLKAHREKREAEASMLARPLTDDALVFGTVDGKPFRPNTVTRAWQTLANRAGVKAIRLHDARHTHATIMLKQGVHPKIVQERLGHTSIEMTLDIYSHVAPGMQQAAAAGFDRVIPTRESEGAEKPH